MKNTSKIECEGQVTELLPNAFFRVKLDNYDYEILCTISGKMKKNNINICLYDKVIIELDTYTLKRGRIIYRKRS